MTHYGRADFHASAVLEGNRRSRPDPSSSIPVSGSLVVSLVVEVGVRRVCQGRSAGRRQDRLESERRAAYCRRGMVVSEQILAALEEFVVDMSSQAMEEWVEK